MSHYSLYFDLLMMVLLGIFGIHISKMGFQGMLRERPVYRIDRGVSTRILFLVWIVLIISKGLTILDAHEYTLSLVNIIILTLISAIIAFFVAFIYYWRIAKSETAVRVMILGINRKVLDLVRGALKRNGIVFTEAHEDFDLSEVNAYIYTTVFNEIGYAALRIDPKDKLPLLEKIVQDMKEYDEGHRDHFSLIFMILLVILGLLMIGGSIVYSYSTMKLLFH
jgi:hypothetical protein